MLDLGQAQQDMMNTEGNLGAYQTPQLPNQVNQAVQEQWIPLLKNATQATQNMMQDFLPRFMNIPYSGLTAGTTAADMTPQQKMQAMGQQLGDMGGRLTASVNLSDYLGGKASEMAQKAQDAMRFGYGTAADAYNRAFQRYQAAAQAAEADKQRAFQASQANAQLRLQQKQAEDQKRLYEQLFGGGQPSSGAPDTFALDIPEDTAPAQDTTPEWLKYAENALTYGMKKNYGGLGSFYYPAAAYINPSLYQSETQANKPWGSIPFWQSIAQGDIKNAIF